MYVCIYIYICACVFACVCLLYIHITDAEEEESVKLTNILIFILLFISHLDWYHTLKDLILPH